MTEPSQGRTAEAGVQARFELVREVGAGGEGRVLAVIDRARGGATLALKETHGPRADALRREFDLLARLSHPALARAWDWFDVSPVGGAAGRAAYTQDWIEGRDLATAARDLDEAGREAVMLALLGALAHLHAAGVAHLDLKPDNVLVDGSGHPCLVDLGIAARLGTRPDVVRGSRSYVAPELLAGAPVAPSADLWAFGRMLAELGVAPEVARALGDPDPATRPASALAVARLWSEARRAPVTLFPPSSAPALVRSGGRVGHERELARAGAMPAVIVTGPAGSGRRSFVKALSHLAPGRAAELWPLGSDADLDGLLATLGRLVPGVALESPPAPASTP
ncbi:MAG: protein kinase, partial [Deltaproteobacteria bacterium]|nr:protein kinase [Deltaproteobacteria bacterium]